MYVKFVYLLGPIVGRKNEENLQIKVLVISQRKWLRQIKCIQCIGYPLLLLALWHLAFSSWNYFFFFYYKLNDQITDQDTSNVEFCPYFFNNGHFYIDILKFRLHYLYFLKVHFTFGRQRPNVCTLKGSICKL